MTSIFGWPVGGYYQLIDSHLNAILENISYKKNNAIRQRLNLALKLGKGKGRAISAITALPLLHTPAAAPPLLCRRRHLFLAANNDCGRGGILLPPEPILFYALTNQQPTDREEE